MANLWPFCYVVCEAREVFPVDHVPMAVIVFVSVWTCWGVGALVCRVVGAFLRRWSVDNC